MCAGAHRARTLDKLAAFGEKLSITAVRADALAATIPISDEPALYANPRSAAAPTFGPSDPGEVFLGYDLAW